MVRWYRSVAVKSVAIAFVCTHVPLLALIALVVVAPGELQPLTVLGLALLSTLLATALVIYALWRLFRPLRQAADGLLKFMTEGQPLRLTAESHDEVSSLIRVLVLALAHLDRARDMMPNAMPKGPLPLPPDPEIGTVGMPDMVALVEIDGWDEVEHAADARLQNEVQDALRRRIDMLALAPRQILPWGRGRYLLFIAGSTRQVKQRLESLSSPLHVASRPGGYRIIGVVESRSPNESDWSEALRRLDRHLFAMRAEGRTAAPDPSPA